MRFACMSGHVIDAWTKEGKPLDLEAHSCPACTGAILNLTDDDRVSRAYVLAPMQETSLTENAIEVATLTGKVVMSRALQPEETGAVHIAFSPLEAIQFARMLMFHAKEAARR